MRSPVTTLVTQFQSLTEVEQKVFLDLVDPQPEPEDGKVKRTRKKKTSAAPTQKRGLPETVVGIDADAMCGLCGNVKDHPDHDRAYLQSHQFEGPKPVARAPRKSKPKSEGTNSTLNIEGEMENVLSASNAGD